MGSTSRRCRQGKHDRDLRHTDSCLVIGTFWNVSSLAHGPNRPNRSPVCSQCKAECGCQYLLSGRIFLTNHITMLNSRLPLTRQTASTPTRVCQLFAESNVSATSCWSSLSEQPSVTCSACCQCPKGQTLRPGQSCQDATFATWQPCELLFVAPSLPLSFI
jgi:hypothetical protein